MHTLPDKANGAAETVTLSALRSPEWMDRLFQKLFFLIPVGIIGNIIFYLFTSDRDVLASLMHFSPWYFALAMVLSIVPWFTGSLRLFMWSRFLGKSIPYMTAFKISIGAELGAAVSPPLIGGSAVRIAMLMRHGFTGAAALSFSVLENMEDAVFFLIMVPSALTISSAWNLPAVRSVLAGLRHPPLQTLLGGVCVCICIGVLLFALTRKIRTAISWLSGFATLGERMRSAYYNFITIFRRIAREGKSIFAMTIALTSLQWICRYSIISLLLVSMGIPVRPVLFMALQVFVFALMTVVPTPGAVGGAEVMFSFVFRAFLPQGTIGLVTAGWRFLTFYFLLLLAAALTLLLGTQQGAEKQNALPQEAGRPSSEITL